MSKNIIICCDGTGNEIEADLSNVFKLYRILKKNPKQVVFYDPGIGTLSTRKDWIRHFQGFKETFCLATGVGLDDNVMDAYRFLVQNYELGDQVYLFGFSRGAYTVRVLAGYIHLIGLLRPEQKNFFDYAYKAYKEASLKDDLEYAWRFKRLVPTRAVPIKFLGVWDTVNSVLIPRPDKIFPSIRVQALPYTAQNPSVEIFRHAIALDEKRRMFRLNRWNEPQKFLPNSFNKSRECPQDIQQVWFSGCHSDVGGGYHEGESGLSKFPLQWMVREAQTAGVKINTAMFNHLVLGKPRKRSSRSYTQPDAVATQHDPIKGAWKLMELLPKGVRFQESLDRKSLFGFYLPRSEPRMIPEGALIHASVLERMSKLSDYRPIGFPKSYKVIDDVSLTTTDKTT